MFEHVSTESVASAELRHGPALHPAEVRCSGTGVGRRKPAGGDGTPDLSGPTDANRLIVGPTMNLPDNLLRLHVDELPIKAASPG